MFSNRCLYIYRPVTLFNFSNLRPWASSIRCSQGADSSMITHNLLTLENMMMSGHMYVGTITSGNRCFKSTSSIQSLGIASIPVAPPRALDLLACKVSDSKWSAFLVVLPRTLYLLAIEIPALTNSSRRCLTIAFITAAKLLGDESSSYIGAIANSSLYMDLYK